jgi:flagellar basal-body rod protein FlgB
MKLFDKTLTTLERSLDARLLRQNLLAGNLANVDTPGFVPRELDFEAAMARSQAQDALPAALPAASASTGAGEISVAGTGIPSLPSLPSLTDLGALSGARPGSGALSPIVTAQGAGAGLDGNAVDLDRTLASIAENTIQYGASAKAAGKKLAILRYVASDGAA